MAAAKKEETKSTNVLDVFLNGWVTQLDIIEELEQRSLDAIKSQNEWLHGTRDQFLQMEENSKKLTSEWTTNIQKLLLDDNKFAVGAPNFPDLVSKLEEIGLRSQTIAFLPGKTSLDILTTAGDQVEKTYTKAISQQQKRRDEYSKAFENVFEQFKQSQVGFFKFFELTPGVLK